MLRTRLSSRLKQIRLLFFIRNVLFGMDEFGFRVQRLFAFLTSENILLFLHPVKNRYKLTRSTQWRIYEEVFRSFVDATASYEMQKQIIYLRTVEILRELVCLSSLVGVEKYNLEGIKKEEDNWYLLISQQSSSITKHLITLTIISINPLTYNPMI